MRLIPVLLLYTLGAPKLADRVQLSGRRRNVFPVHMEVCVEASSGAHHLVMIPPHGSLMFSAAPRCSGGTEQRELRRHVSTVASDRLMIPFQSLEARVVTVNDEVSFLSIQLLYTCGIDRGVSDLIRLPR